jgi:cephalosporin-C deacetylase-like acetyl esterase
LSGERVEQRPAAVPTRDIGTAIASNAEPVLQDMAARTELHLIDTLTLSDTQFLHGNANGKPTTTSRQLRLAKSSGRLPVVVLQHGSGGMAPNIEMWTRELNKIGISTFALDGFTGRGLTEVNTNQALLGRLNFILDIYRALDVLANHPSVDPARIALIAALVGCGHVSGLFVRRYGRWP